MSNAAYLRKIAPARNKLDELSTRLNQSNSDYAHEIYYELTEVEELLINPFQTVPKEHFVHVTTTLCDENGDSDKAYCDLITEFDREITAGHLYVKLKNYVEDYREGYYLQISLQQLEDWLNQQKPLFKTVKKGESFIEDSGITIGDFKTDFGSIDFFLEYGINNEE